MILRDIKLQPVAARDGALRDVYLRRRDAGQFSLLTLARGASKIMKSDNAGAGYRSAILYLAPADTVRGVNICAGAVAAGCREACLYTAGRGKMAPVKRARINRTRFLRDYPAEFIDCLAADLRLFTRRAHRAGLRSVVRLNGTSDIDWPTLAPELFALADQFYDYTKIAARARRDRPNNYHLTLSYSAARSAYSGQIMRTVRDTGLNVATVFRSAPPAVWQGLPVFDGDKTDLRFLDPGHRPHCIALRAKGAAKFDNGGFTVE